MKLIFRCSKCWKSNELKGRFHSRFDIARVKGEEFDIECSHCGEKVNLVPDSITAKENKVLGLIFIAIIIIVFVSAYFIFTKFVDKNPTLIIGFILLIPILVYTTYSKAEEKRVEEFNRHKYDNK